MTTITRPNPRQRLRLVGSEEARATGTADARKLLAETFSADEVRTPADALYSTLVELLALAHDNRVEECNERLKGFCEVVGPVLYRPQASAVLAVGNGAMLLNELKAAHDIIRNALAVQNTHESPRLNPLLPQLSLITLAFVITFGLGQLVR